MKPHTILGSWIRKFYQIQILTTFCVPKRVFFCEKKTFYLKASLRAFSKRVFFTKTKSLLRRLKSLFSNTFSPFSINLEPKGGMLLLFWCLLKLLAVVDHSQMSFEETSSLVNVHWTNTIPVQGWYDNISENCSVTFSTMLITVWLLCGLFCKDVSKFIFLSVSSPYIFTVCNLGLRAACW